MNKSMRPCLTIARTVEGPHSLRFARRLAGRKRGVAFIVDSVVKAVVMSRLKSQHLRWRLDRQRTFSVQVVEPQIYKPNGHASLFEKTIEQLLSPTAAIRDDFSQPVLIAEPFDLLGFPEAFAPISALLTVLHSLDGIGQLGCIHVGLRPNEEEPHLFQVATIRYLLSELRTVPNLAVEDLIEFEKWLADQTEGWVFNLGCLFAVDHEARLRICLHPKLVRSKFEHSAMPEINMKEANLLSLVTLEPTDPRLLTLTIQPLICSDALDIPTDAGNPAPMLAINTQEAEIADRPDHVDIVSIVMCTPQVDRFSRDGKQKYRDWHGDYRSTFCSAAKNAAYARHHFATFILTNFAIFDEKGSGLSGLFQPVDPKANSLNTAVQLCRYGKDATAASDDNDWFGPDDPPVDPENGIKWQWRAFTAGLRPVQGEAVPALRIFGFTIPRMLRDVSPWTKPQGPVSCRVLAGHFSPEDGLAISEWSAS